MRAVQVLGDVASPTIATNNSLPTPNPRNSEILLRVHAAGITGDEVLWPELYETSSRIPGHDVSGVIAELGPDYSGPLKIGQEVFAFIAAAQGGGGQADYVICHANEIAPKPASISHAQAAALPIPLLTAWEAIYDHGAALKSDDGMRVLITGASGAVGRLAVQVAVSTGAYVIALASGRHQSMLKELGAHEVIDYNTPDWERTVKNVELVFDTVGGDILARTWETIKYDGTIVTVGDPPPSWAFEECQPVELARFPNVKYKYFVVSPNVERMGRAAEMIDAGTIRPLDVKVFPFEEAEEAWRCARQRGRGHKVVVTFVG